MTDNDLKTLCDAYLKLQKLVANKESEYEDYIEDTIEAMDIMYPVLSAHVKEAGLKVPIKSIESL